MSPLALRPDVRHGQRLRSFLALRTEAREAVDDAKVTQSEVAELLDVSQAAVSAALNDTEGKRTGTLIRIIEALTPYTVEEERTVEYRVVRKA